MRKILLRPLLFVCLFICIRPATPAWAGNKEKTTVSVESYAEMIDALQQALLDNMDITVYCDLDTGYDSEQIWKDVYQEAIPYNCDLLALMEDDRILKQSQYYISDESGGRYGTKVVFTYFNNNETSENELDMISKNLALSGKTAYETTLAIHDYICQTYEYENEKTFPTLHTSLKTGKTQCVGYANLFYELAKRNGIPCRYISGSDNYGEFHVWNLVELDGQWYHVDCTWDDVLQSHAYFLAGSLNALNTHRIWGIYSSCLSKYDIALNDYTEKEQDN